MGIQSQATLVGRQTTARVRDLISSSISKSDLQIRSPPDLIGGLSLTILCIRSAGKEMGKPNADGGPMRLCSSEYHPVASPSFIMNQALTDVQCAL